MCHNWLIIIIGFNINSVCAVSCCDWTRARHECKPDRWRWAGARRVSLCLTLVPLCLQWFGGNATTRSTTAACLYGWSRTTAARCASRTGWCRGSANEPRPTSSRAPFFFLSFFFFNEVVTDWRVISRCPGQSHASRTPVPLPVGCCPDVKRKGAWPQSETGWRSGGCVWVDEARCRVWSRVRVTLLSVVVTCYCLSE